MIRLLTLLTLCLSLSTFAQLDIDLGELEVVEISEDGTERIIDSFLIDTNTDPKKPKKDRKVAEKVGKAIKVGKDLIALGEAGYKLVDKGRPSSVNEYAPISVVPRLGDDKAVSPFSLEGWSAPTTKKYSFRYKKGFGTAVEFDYAVIFSHSGSFDQKGKYLTAVMIKPEHISVKYGWDFDASFKLESVLNHGTSEDPMAGAVISISFHLKSMLKSITKNVSFHVVGDGSIKKL